MGHIKSLDGIRAIAVISIVFFHLGLLPAGWVGVQIFFVLSGFLITSILAGPTSADLRSYLARFYWRRSLRIFPLYFFFLAVASIAFASFHQDWPWLVSYTANFARLRAMDLGAPFVHLWSLAVEEQFYLIWPLLVFFLSRSGLRRLAIMLLILAPLTRLGIFMTFGSAMGADWLGRTIYSLPSSQADAFAAGALVALLEVKRPAPLFAASLCVLAVAGAAVLAHQHLGYHAAIKWTFGYSMFLLQDGGVVWGYSLLNIAAALGIACAIKYRLMLLELGCLRRIGTVSYGIYVYHVPLIVALEHFAFLHSALIPLCLAATYILAEISYRCLETPFLKLKERSPGLAAISAILRPSTTIRDN